MKLVFTLALFLNLFVAHLFSQSYIIKYDSVPCLNGASIRGMSVVNDSIAWISGSKGTVARTLNGGRTWERITCNGFGKKDFRSVEAFNKDSVYMINSGDSSTLFSTKNGGQNWLAPISSHQKEIFMDATCWWDYKNGIVLGDPLGSQFFALYFRNGESSTGWDLVAKPGEACFAASGTCLRIKPGGWAWIATGGAESRMFVSKNYGKSWINYPCPVIHGKPSQGAFSVIFTDSLNGIVVGGDYTQPNLLKDNCAITHDGGKSWSAPKVPPGGYRSCIENISPGVFIATGISGTDYSTDGGMNWKNFDKQSFNVVSKAKNGNLILIAGDKGKVGIILKK